MKPNSNATQRTHNRLNEHTLRPVHTDPNSPVIRDPGTGNPLTVQAVLTTCVDKGCNWKGWLPVTEVTLTE